MKRYTSALLGIVALLSTNHFLFGQATVNESLETAYIYVNGTTGNDNNSGTKSEPLKTIQAAISMAETNNQNNIGSLITVDAGTYRESLSFSHNKKDTDMPITLEAATDGTVIVSGSTLYTGWTEYSKNNSIYQTSWTNNWGECAQLTSCSYQQDIMMRQEMLIVNGTPMTQVMSIAQMLAGTFYVDESANLIYVWPPSGTKMSTATVEAASTSTLLNISNKNDIVVRGLTFQYANSCRGSAAVNVQGPSTNILFDTDVFQWNNGQGIAINNPVTYFTVQKSSALHNGDTGFQESETQYGLWSDDTASYNNWRGAQGAYYACNTAGFHGWEAHNDTIDGLTLSFNEAYGAHWDTDNVNISASGVNATSNLYTGLFIEKNLGPISFDSSYSCNHTSPYAVGGFILRNSENVSLTNSVLYNNTPSQIGMIGIKGGIKVTDWVTNKSTNLITQNFVNTGNTIQGTSSSQLVFKDSYLDDSDWTTFKNSLTSSSNTWYNAANSSTPFVVPTPKSGTSDDFSSWQSASDADSNSSWKSPKSTIANTCNLTPEGPDFWITIDNALLTAKQGKSATYNLNLTPLNFTGTVTLSLDGITEVKGLSATLSPNSIKTSGSSVLTVSSTTSTPKGTYSIVVMANNGNITRTVTTQLTIN